MHRAVQIYNANRLAFLSLGELLCHVTTQSVCLSACLFVCLSVSLSACLFVCLSVCLADDSTIYVIVWKNRTTPTEFDQFGVNAEANELKLTRVACFVATLFDHGHNAAEYA